MNYRKLIVATAFTMVVAASPVAFAQRNPEFLSLTVRADLNRDGVLTRAEADAFARSREGQRILRRWDRNGDGVLSRREWRGDRNSFASFDRNRDGVISSRDHVRPAVSRYNHLDRDRNGIVTRAEWRGHGDWQSFQRLDLNDDGILSGRELR